jgi:3-dehydroquinate dehydratase-1
MAAPVVSPLVVGTISADALAAYALCPADENAPDIVEMRLDLAADATGDVRPALEAARRLEQAARPVMVTIRLAADGGRWPGDGDDRLSRFQAALDEVSWVDVEATSAIAGAVIALARTRGRQVVVSHHDFTGTPAPDDLAALIVRARGLGGDIVKVATKVSSLADHDALVDVLRARRGGEPPLALVAMGAMGTSLRSYLPCVGSRLTYGFIDRPAAPGQIAARDLVSRLLVDCPAYAASRGRETPR